MVHTGCSLSVLRWLFDKDLLEEHRETARVPRIGSTPTICAGPGTGCVRTVHGDCSILDLVAGLGAIPQIGQLQGVLTGGLSKLCSGSKTRRGGGRSGRWLRHIHELDTEGLLLA